MNSLIEVVKFLENENLPAIPEQMSFDIYEANLYLEIARKMSRIKELNSIDGISIANAARIVKLYENAWETLAKNGAIQVFKNKTRNVSPEWTVWVTLEGKLRKTLEALTKDAKGGKEENQSTVDKMLSELLN